MTEKQQRKHNPIEYSTVFVPMTGPGGKQHAIKMFEVSFDKEKFQGETKAECRTWMTAQRKAEAEFPKINTELVKIEDRLLALRIGSSVDEKHQVKILAICDDLQRIRDERHDG